MARYAKSLMVGAVSVFLALALLPGAPSASVAVLLPHNLGNSSCQAVAVFPVFPAVPESHLPGPANCSMLAEEESVASPDNDPLQATLPLTSEHLLAQFGSHDSVPFGKGTAHSLVSQHVRLQI